MFDRVTSAAAEERGAGSRSSFGRGDLAVYRRFRLFLLGEKSRRGKVGKTPYI